MNLFWGMNVDMTGCPPLVFCVYCALPNHPLSCLNDIFQVTQKFYFIKKYRFLTHKKTYMQSLVLRSLRRGAPPPYTPPPPCRPLCFQYSAFLRDRSPSVSLRTSHTDCLKEGLAHSVVLFVNTCAVYCLFPHRHFPKSQREKRP